MWSAKPARVHSVSEGPHPTPSLACLQKATAMVKLLFFLQGALWEYHRKKCEAHFYAVAAEAAKMLIAELRPLTMRDIYRRIALKTGLRVKDVKAVFAELRACAYEEVAKTGYFKIPGLVTFKVVVKPATKTHKKTAKPAKKVVKAFAVKALKYTLTAQKAQLDLQAAAPADFSRGRSLSARHGRSGAHRGHATGGLLSPARSPFPLA